ncbi:MAG: amidohydrolase family protein [Solirubrobacteraceae bacterium]
MRIVTGKLVFAEDTWIVDGAVAHEDGVIATTGTAQAVRAAHPEAEVDDWGDVAIVPGGVNGHGHTFQVLVRGFGDDLRFADWMGGLVHPTAATLDRTALETGALFDFAEMVRFGITTAVEFFYLHDNANDNAMAVIDAGRQVGLRTVMARCMFDADPGPARYRETPEEFERNFRELAAALDGDPLAHAQPAPHSVLGTSAAMLRLGAELAAEFDVPLHIHLADNAGEVAVSRERFGASPIGYLDELGVLDERTLAVHAVAVDEDDLDLLAKTGATVVHNPSTNAFLGGGIAPVVAMRDRGIPVCLGTDAGGANNRQSLFEEMRMAALLAKAVARDGSVFTAEEALLMGTAAGGRALRLPVGRLAQGYHADLVAVDLTALSMQPRATATHNLIYSMQPDAILRVAVGGRVIVERGEVLTTDVDRIAARVNELTAGWKPLTGVHPLAQ